MFEIGLLILGFLYIGDMYFNSIIDLIQVMKDISDEDEEKQKDAELKEISKHLYS